LICAEHRRIAADAASGEQGSKEHGDQGAHRRSRLLGRRIEIS
jgi:hypothetical protein